MVVLYGYLFISGCPRSGTTALTELLNSHSRIALGMERYKYVIRQGHLEELTSRLFEAERFLNVQPEETNFAPVKDHKARSFYEKIREKFNTGNALIVGDKMPLYFLLYEELDQTFENAKHIFLLRNVENVASSFNAKASNPRDTSWPENNDYVKAVFYWNLSLEKAWEYFKRRPNQMFICEYEKIFSCDHDYLGKLLNFLEIEPEQELMQKYQQMTQDWETRLSKQKVLEDSQKTYVQENANFSLVHQLLQQFS